MGGSGVGTLGMFPAAWLVDPLPFRSQGRAVQVRAGHRRGR